jgi:hypothetical protein
MAVGFENDGSRGRDPSRRWVWQPPDRYRWASIRGCAFLICVKSAVEVFPRVDAFGHFAIPYVDLFARGPLDKSVDMVQAVLIEKGFSWLNRDFSRPVFPALSS